MLMATTVPSLCMSRGTCNTLAKWITQLTAYERCGGIFPSFSALKRSYLHVQCSCASLSLLLTRVSAFCFAPSAAQVAMSTGLLQLGGVQLNAPAQVDTERERERECHIVRDARVTFFPQILLLAAGEKGKYYNNNYSNQSFVHYASNVYHNSHTPTITLSLSLTLSPCMNLLHKGHTADTRKMLSLPPPLDEDTSESTY